MKVQKLSNEEAAQAGFTHLVTVTHEDLTNTSASGTPTQTLEPITVGAGDLVHGPFALRLITAFKHAADSAQNSTTVQVGDGGDTDRFITSTELNENGTEVLNKAGTGTLNMYTAADTIDLLFTGTASKALSDLDTGELHVFCNLTRTNNISAAGA